MKDVLDIAEVDKTKKYPIASRNKRFANHIIDSFVILILSIPIFYIFSSDSSLFFDSEQGSFRIMSYVIIGLATVVYYILSEFYFNGKTVGKFITGTRAVTLDNEKMDLGTVVKRSFCRLVPFNALSFLSGLPIGWHDEWTDTKVILDRH